MPNFNPVELEAYVRQRAPEIAGDIRTATQKARNEADLVAEVEKLLDKFSKNFDVTLHLERERTLINGRADAVYNRFVIEYEPPKSLQKSNTYRTNKHAIEQVQQYIGGLERLDRQRKERLAGVVLDGGFYIFIRYRDDRWRIDDPLPVDVHSTETFLRYLLSLSTELALTPENLVRDFGENSNTARQVVPALYQAIQTTKSAKVDTLFRQWQQQFREVSGYDPASGQLEPAELARLYAVKNKNPDLERLFFVVHTYYATFIKLLALQVAYYYLMPKVGSGLAAAADKASDELCHWLQDMERGGLFAQLGIRNFLEGDFFGWYLDIWDDPLELALKRLIGDLANYSLVTLDVDPEETRDLLKQLYQNLMPKKLRHALGEYYTPDWLAERLLNQLGYDGDPAKRILDPACGSGTFPVLAIKRARRYAEDKMLPPAQTLEQILDNIVGFDLNPLAVISARTNYLLALGELLEYRRGDISIPIYLADSILTPSQGTDLFTQSGYSFNTAVGRFTVPRSLVQAHYIDQLAGLLEDCVHLPLTLEQFRSRILQTFPLKEPEDLAEISLLESLYNQLLKLEQQGINGIWARIIKNAFAPLFQGRFDYVMGNPPWVNWESLPSDYRQETAYLWKYYGMAALKGKQSDQFELGKQRRDISTLMTYVVIDKYVRDGGRLGFLITQTVFKSVGSEGFRQFRLPNGTMLGVIAVDDMVNIKPFEGASNRTSIVLIERGRKTKYPIPYSYWYKPSGGTTISEDLSLKEILNDKIATYREYVAEPVDEDDQKSPWISSYPKALRAIKKLRGKSDYKGMVGTCSWLNGVYWVEVTKSWSDGTLLVRNITERAKIAVENVEVTLEPDLVFPLLRAGDIKGRWRANSVVSIIVPHTPETSWQAIPENRMKVSYPKTYAYLLHFRDLLVSRSGYRLLRQGHPFYILGDIHTNSFAPYKVVWPNIGTKLTAAVIGARDTKVIIPQHIVSFIPFNDENEAYYVSAIVNSSPFNFSVQSFTQKGGKSFGTPSILNNINVPNFDNMNPFHIQLSKLAQQAHTISATSNNSEIQMIESEIDELAAKIWGLANDEIHEIQESLEELNQ